jgi:hypothetical protein
MAWADQETRFVDPAEGDIGALVRAETVDGVVTSMKLDRGPLAPNRQCRDHRLADIADRETEEDRGDRVVGTGDFKRVPASTKAYSANGGGSPWRRNIVARPLL